MLYPLVTAKTLTFSLNKSTFLRVHFFLGVIMRELKSENDMNVNPLCWKDAFGDDTRRAIICFDERLSITLRSESTADPKLIGNYCIFVEAIGQHCHQFLVHLQSSMTRNGYSSGSKVISSVTQKYLCLEEKRTEYKYVKNGLHERTLFMGYVDDVYYIEVGRNCPCEKFSETKLLPVQINDNLLGEGASLLLMRYLAINDYDGSLCHSTITINGEPAMYEYKCTAAKYMKLNDQRLRIYTIKCTLCDAKGPIQRSKTYFTPNGRILRHDLDCMPYILQISSLTSLEMDSNACSLYNCIEQRLLDDIELRSKYLDRKNCQEVQRREYLVDHPEVKQLIMDYTQTLLIVKPLDVLNFTIQYFKVFLSKQKA